MNEPSVMKKVSNDPYKLNGTTTNLYVKVGNEKPAKGI